MAVPFTARNLIEVAAQAVEACLPWANEPVHPTGPLEITAAMCVGPKLVGEGSRQVQVQLIVPTASGIVEVGASCVVHKNGRDEVCLIDDVAIYCGSVEPTRPFGQRCRIMGTRQNPMLRSEREEMTGTSQQLAQPAPQGPPGFLAVWHP